MRTPILLVAFNRPEVTARVVDCIRKAKPQLLYLAVDGPRLNHPDDHERTREVRELCSEVDWPCDVKTLFRSKNLGCKESVSSAITWFFKHEEEGIILEDDCLPAPEFFPFCDDLLARYRHNPDIWCITGDNFQQGIARGSASYYFSKYPHVWGWATWRRCWNCYDIDMAFWPKWRNSKHFRRLFPNQSERFHWRYVFDNAYQQRIDTWDFQWLATIWRRNGLTATPQNNLVTNIGFGPEATHTRKRNDKLVVPLSAQPISGLVHPAEVAADPEADAYTFANVFHNHRIKPSWHEYIGDKLAFVFDRIRNVAPEDSSLPCKPL